MVIAYVTYKISITATIYKEFFATTTEDAKTLRSFLEARLINFSLFTDRIKPFVFVCIIIIKVLA